MIKCIIFFIIWITTTFSTYSYHHQFIAITNEEKLFPKQAVVAISHRFNGTLFKDDGIFGQNLGANVAYFLRFGLPHKQSLNIQSSNLYNQFSILYKKSYIIQNEKIFGLAYSIDRLNLISSTDTTTSLTSFYGTSTKKYDAILNLIYRDYFSSLQVGAGISYSLLNDSKVFYEIFTPIKSYKQNFVHVLGLKMMTFGHNFYFFISNVNEVGAIPASSGASDMTFHSGFKIERIFDF